MKKNPPQITCHEQFFKEFGDKFIKAGLECHEHNHIDGSVTIWHEGFTVEELYDFFKDRLREELLDEIKIGF